MRRARCTAMLMLAVAALPSFGADAPPDGDYAYRTRPGDTLIGLGQRLLREPRRWHDLQAINRIERPRQMPRDTLLLIPYRWLRLTAETAAVVAVAGDARRGAQPVAVGAQLAEGTVLDTGANGSVTLSMPDGSVVTMQKSSHLVLERLERIDGLGAHDVSLSLSAGRVETQVQPQRDVGRFEIRTPVAVTAVRGTRFRATFDTSDADARTETLEGTVGVSANATLVPVPHGYGTRVEQGAAPSPPLQLPPPPVLSGIEPVNAAPDLVLDFAPVAGASRYRLQLASEQRFYSIARDEDVASPGARLQALADGEYWLRVRSITPQGLEGPDAVHHFMQRLAPAAPEPMTPAGDANIPGRNVTFAWAPNAAADSYVVEVAREPAFADLVSRTSGITQPRLAVDDLPAGSYFWRVAAVTAERHAGPYSPPQRFRLRGLAPQPRVALDARSAHLSWDTLGSDAYEVEVAHDAAFRYVVASATVTGDHWESPALHCGDYYARVRPIDADGYSGVAGPVREFHVPYPAWVRFAPLALVLPFL